jgi:hypothetical protein
LGAVFHFSRRKTATLKIFRRLNVKKEKQLIRQREKRKSVNISRFVYSAILVLIFCAVFSMPVLAAAAPAAEPTVWDKAQEIMQDVYKQILLISTIAAIVTAAVALLLMNFSKSGKTVDESRSWLKRIIITWVILNGLGFIMSYVTPFLQEGNGIHKKIYHKTRRQFSPCRIAAI